MNGFRFEFVDMLTGRRLRPPQFAPFPEREPLPLHLAPPTDRERAARLAGDELGPIPLVHSPFLRDGEWHLVDDRGRWVS